MARVEKTRAVRQVLAREEHLRDLLVHLLEGLLISPHEAALPDGGGGLLVRQALGVFRQSQLLDAAHDRAGGDHHDLPALRLQRGQLAGEPVDALGVQAAALGGYEAAAHLEHEALGVFDNLVPHCPTRSPLMVAAASRPASRGISSTASSRRWRRPRSERIASRASGSTSATSSDFSHRPRCRVSSPPRHTVSWPAPGCTASAPGAASGGSRRDPPALLPRRPPRTLDMSCARCGAGTESRGPCLRARPR